jgi:hypothetical protein
MEPFYTLRRRRRRRRVPNDRTQPRRPRVVGRAAPRPVAWWIALGLLALAWWFPLTMQAQGLKSTTTSVSLVATRLPDAPRQMEDIAWDVGPLPDSGSTVHLVGGPAGIPLYVREASGRLVSLGTGGVVVHGPKVVFRIIDPAHLPPGTTWRVQLTQAGIPRRHLEVRATQPR